MSSTYTYTRVVKNINQLIANVQSRVSKAYGLNYYDYNAGSSLLVLSFTKPLDPINKAALDLTVNTFPDSSILTPEDLQASKYIRVAMAADQTLSTPINSVSDVLFHSATHIDRLFYQQAANNKFIFLQKPGVYLISGKVGARLASGRTPGSTTVLQWAVQYDDTKAEIAYIPLNNSAVYTTHTSANNSADSTLYVACINVTSSTGTNVKVVCKVMSGTTPLQVDADQTSFSIISVPDTSVFEGNSSATAALNATTPTTVNFGTHRVVQYPFTATIGQPSVTLQQSGYVIVFCKATFNKTTGTDPTIGTVYPLLNGTAITTTSPQSHSIAAANNKTTIHSCHAIAVNVGDVLTMQAKLVQGSALTYTAAETGMTCIYVSTILRDTTSAVYSILDTPVSGISSTTTDIDITRDTLNLPLTGLSMMHYSNGRTSVPTAGLYLVVYQVTFVNAGSTPREVGAWLATTVDAGKTFYYHYGSLAIKQSAAGTSTIVSTSTLLNLPDGAQIKLQAASNGLLSDNISVTGHCTTTMINYEDVAYNLEPQGIFGREFAMIRSVEPLQVTSPAYIEKCRIVTPYLTSGIYRVMVSAVISVPTNNTTPLNVQLLEVNSASGLTFVVYTKSIAFPPNGTYPYMSLDYINASNGVHTIIFQLSTQGSTFTCFETTMEIWRVT